MLTSQTSTISTANLPYDALFVPGSYILREQDDFWRNPHPMITDVSSANIVDLHFHAKNHTARVMSVHFNHDFSLTLHDSLWTPNSFKATFHGRSDWCIMLLRLSGNSIESINDDHYRLGAFSCSLVNVTEQVKYTMQLAADEQLINITIAFRPDFLKRKFSSNHALLKDILHPNSNECSTPWFSQCTMTPTMENIVHELRGSCISNSTYRLIAESKALELIALYLQQLEWRNAYKQPVNCHEMQCLQTAKNYLAQHYQDPPSIEYLSRLVGLNRRKITEGFKAMYGKTISDYVFYLRMEKAKTLLLSHHSNISFVAEQVGYQHQSNFTKAFKRYAGLPPRQFAMSLSNR